MKNLKIFIYLLICLVLFCQTVNAKPSKKELDNYLKEHTLVIVKNDEIILSDERGIKPLISAIQKDQLQDAFVADRVAGKAAALLYAYGRVDSVYVQMVSKSAIKVLKDNHIKIKYKANKVVPVIINRDKTDICPMEKKVLNVDNPQQAWEILNK